MKELTGKLAMLFGLGLSLTLVGGCAPETEPGSATESEGLAENVETVEQALDWCSCVNYMFRRFPSWGSWGPASAKDYGPWLVQNHGYTNAGQDARVWDVVIMQPGFSAAPVDATHGHIAVVTAISWTGGQRRIHYTGANQPGTQYSAYNCYNVTSTYTDYHSSSNTRIAFYRK